MSITAYSSLKIKCFTVLIVFVFMLLWKGGLQQAFFHISYTWNQFINSSASVSSYQLIAFMLANSIKLITHHQREFRRDCPGCMFSEFYGCLSDMDTGDNVVHVWPQQYHQLPVVLKGHGCTWSFPATQYLSMSTFPPFMPLSSLYLHSGLFKRNEAHNKCKWTWCQWKLFHSPFPFSQAVDIACVSTFIYVVVSNT